MARQKQQQQCCAVCRGEDSSGDIRRPQNVTAICASASMMAKDLGCGGAILVTADGSIDCQENPNEQVGTSACNSVQQQDCCPLATAHLHALSSALLPKRQA